LSHRDVPAGVFDQLPEQLERFRNRAATLVTYPDRRLHFGGGNYTAGDFQFVGGSTIQYLRPVG
jgi:hypothetical protein